jgi:hypothetical protein
MIECMWERDEGGIHYIAWIDERGTHVIPVVGYKDAIVIILSNECVSL